MPRIAGDMIKFVGLRSLDDSEKTILNDLSTRYYGKVKRSLHNLTQVTVNVKVYKEEGKKKKYSIHATASAPMRQRFTSTKAHDWDLKRTLHKAFKDLLMQIEHGLKTTSGRSYSKAYEKRSVKK